MDLIYSKILRDRRLTPEEKKQIFERPDAEELVKLAILSWIDFYDEQDLFLTLPHPSEVIKLFISRNGVLNDRLEKEIFDFSDAEDVVKHYVSNEGIISRVNGVKLFSLPHASEVIKLCIQKELSFSREVIAEFFNCRMQKTSLCNILP